jgi:hypothetical protein
MVIFQEFSSECAVLDWQDRDEEIEDEDLIFLNYYCINQCP